MFDILFNDPLMSSRRLAWLDLRAEPIVISVPEVPKDRYCVLQCIDLFTYNCAYIGSRSTGGDLQTNFQSPFAAEMRLENDGHSSFFEDR